MFRFFISAPKVFHMGVPEKVYVQLGKRHLNNPVTLYLKHDIAGTVVSERKYVVCDKEMEPKNVELMV